MSRESETREHEVVVLGAGPAGCAAAIVLARAGRDVGLVRPSSTVQGALCVSVPPSACKLLTEIDVLSALERAALHPNTGNTVWWAGRPVRRESFAAGASGFHVDRQGLENVLAAVAAERGVTIHRALARSAREEAGTWRIECSRADGSRLGLRAPWAIDATGRRGLLARHHGREPDHDTTTICILGRWRMPGGWPVDEATHTLVESYVSGWAWSVPLARGVRCFAAMVDHRYGTLEGLDPATMLTAELMRTEHLKALLRGAEPDGAPWACPASLYSSRRHGRPGLLLAGDAGSFIDPLSSYGAKKALSSGWLAALVAHTALSDPSMEPVALELFDRREREVYHSYRAASAPYFAEAAAAYGHPYWIARAEAAARHGEHGGRAAHADPDALEPWGVPEARVREAFDVLRARERLDAVRGSTLRTVERGAVSGDRVVLATHLASDACPEGLRFVRSVDVRPLVELAVRHDDVAELWAAYNAAAAPVPLPDFVTALATAFAAGLLEHAEARSR
ncbi:MAG TPA: tryptophan 7-halogenase [Longimicrobiales bacterium]|nr:tryptophan 7-halogenase [Longimicrobiales bacterium]